MKNNYMKCLFVGDIFLGKNDNFILDSKLKKLISESDLVSCNFEGPLDTKGANRIEKIGPILEQKENAVNELSVSGFNFFNLSNNHIMDYGKSALSKTIGNLNGKNYAGAGLSFEDAYKINISKINKIKIGVLSFCQWGYGVIDKNNGIGFSWINHPKTNKIIKDSKKLVDFLIVQIHAGEEQINLPQPQWRKRYKEIIDLGADVIIGHHPHVPQPIEIYKNKIIAYSLGNFYFKNFQNKKNYIVLLNVDRKINLEVFPVIQKENEIHLTEDEKFVYWIKNYFRENEVNYRKEYSSQARKIFNEEYKNYFWENKLIRLIKNLIKRILRMKVVTRELGMRHLRKIESHLYLVSDFIGRKEIKRLTMF